MTNHAAMFDLDGTLVDTLSDIAAAGNYTMAQLGRPALTIEEYRMLVGRGTTWLFSRALGTDDPLLLTRANEFYTRYYDAHGTDLSQPYDGISQLLDSVSAAGLKLAVFSNKPQRAVDQVMADILSRWQFDVVEGYREGRPLKPDPTVAWEICTRLNIAASDWVFLGDTAIDMKTARSAGMFAVGALWGFRDKAELQEAGAEAIIGRPREMLDLF